MATVYAVAFSGDEFLMVFNERRNGWEMPGGSIEGVETVEEAVKREFLEEAGYRIDVLKTRNLGGCGVCACLLLEKVNSSPEMASELFLEVPENTAFERSEYNAAVPWARSIAGSRVCCR